MIHFTSDTHFSHKHVIKYCERPFKTLDEMDESLIESWNKQVQPDDVIYHLGDFSLTNPQKTVKILERLNGEIYLIKGNHEKSVLGKEITRKFFKSISDVKKLYIDDKMIFMSHYSHRVWDKSQHGSYHIFGHSHGDLNHLDLGLSMDVGVDSIYKIFGEYRPISWLELKTYMDGK